MRPSARWFLGLGFILPGLLPGLFAGLAIGVSAAGADSGSSETQRTSRFADDSPTQALDMILIVPSDGPDGGDIDIDIDTDMDTGVTSNTISRQLRGGTIGNIDLFDTSPNNLANYAEGQITVGIYSPFGWIPRYRLRGRVISAPASTVAGLDTPDIGMGVTDVIGRAPRITPAFDYDPATSSKNIDDEPLFDGTVATLNAGDGLLYATRARFNGSWNYFTLRFAVGPQYFTPATSHDVDLELSLELY